MTHSADVLPPSGLTRARQALWWLKQGGFALGPEWTKAHELCQMQEGDLAHDRVHALSHWIEGDESNASYWYRRTGLKRAGSIPEEWQKLDHELPR